MPKYTVGAGSKITVRARSRIHDTTTVWDRVTGDIDAAADSLATTGARARFTVDMSSFDAGDWLKNRKLKSDFELDRHREAIFEVTAVRDVARTGDRFTAIAEGTLRWRGKDVPLTVKGSGTLDDRTIKATGSFDLDIRTLGLSAPRFLMFKVEDEVTVDVTLDGHGAVMRRASFGVALVVVALATSCKQGPAEFAGIGPWSVTKTTLKDATGRCDPTDLPDGRKGSYCYLQPLLPIGKQAADVDLYFGGTEPTAPLVELQVKIKVCEPEASDLWLRTHFGAPFESRPGRLFFQNRHLFLAAQLPGEGGRCHIRIFPLSEKAEFERVKAL